MNDYALLGDRSVVLFDIDPQTKANVMHMHLYESISGEEPAETDRKPASSFIRLSAIDGHVEEYINVPEDFRGVDLTVANEPGAFPQRLIGRTYHIITHKDGLLLHNQETDTIYLYNKEDYTLTPYMVQEPSVKSLSPGIYINTVIDRGNYQFIELHTLKIKLPGPLVTTNLVRDKRNGNINIPRIILNDFKGKEIVIDRTTIQKMQNVEEGLLTFTVDELREAYTANRLSGELKVFTERLDEENENDVLAILRFK
jgi:hypothetical protein